MDWLLYDRDLCHERVGAKYHLSLWNYKPHDPQSYFEICQTSMIEFFGEIINGF